MPANEIVITKKRNKLLNIENENVCNPVMVQSFLDQVEVEVIRFEQSEIMAPSSKS